MDQLYSDSKQIFERNLYFTGCLLYPNVTHDVLAGSFPANETANLTAYAFISNATAQSARSAITTCLPIYCASQSHCTATQMCDVGNLLTNNYELSGQGVAECWLNLCSESVEVVNLDIAGVGVCISFRSLGRV